MPRSAAGAGRPGHREDHGDCRGRRTPGQRARHRPGPDPGAYLQPEGRRGTPGADHAAAGPHHQGAAGPDLSQLRLRAGAPGLRTGWRGAADAAARPRAAAGGPAAAARRRRGRRRELARAAAGRARHQGLRRRAAGLPAPGRRARAGRARPGPAGRSARARRLGGRRPVLESYAARFDLAPVPAYDYAEIVRIAGALLARSATRDRERQATTSCSSTNTRTPTRRRRTCCMPWPGTAGS